MNNPFEIDAQRIRRAFDKSASRYDAVAVLQRTVTDRLMESFDFLDISPRVILDLGSGTGYGAGLLRKRFKKSTIYHFDLSTEMLRLARKQSPRFFSRERFICGNASTLPLGDQSIDVVFSSFMLQWCTDLDSAFEELARVLKPGGLFIFATMGPDSLKELRESWRLVDENAHVNAFIDMHDVGDAMMRNGLQEPVLSVEHMKLLYEDAKTLMRELKAIGAQNINAGRRKTLTGKRRMQQLLEHYERFRVDDRLPATYEVIYGHGWKGNQALATGEPGVTTVTLDSLRQSLKKRKETGT